ncbi:putative bcs1 AAA-type ATPase [Thermoascus aurantiacus ATCC 26904]
MFMPGMSPEAVRLLNPCYTYLRELIKDVLGFDPMILVNIGIILLGCSTFIHYIGNFLYGYAEQICLPSVHIYDDDPIYKQVMCWMTDHQFNTRQFRSSRAVSTHQDTSDTSEGDEDDAMGYTFNYDSDTLVSYHSVARRTPIRLQPLESAFLFRHRGSLFRFTQREGSGKSSASNTSSERGHMKLQCLSLSTVPLRTLLEDAQLYNLEKTIRKTNIFRAMSEGPGYIYWSSFTSRPPRHISTVILDKEKKRAILKDMNEYLHPVTRRWYANHGIPCRRGYLFSGAPGTGKTSLSAALAGVFGLDIYVLSLQDPNMNDSHLMKLMSEVPRRCIVLLEDIDAAGLNRPDNSNGEGDAPDGSSSSSSENNHAQPTIHPHRHVNISLLRATSSSPSCSNPSSKVSVTLSGLLNAIDGVCSPEGRILIMTTNSPESLDKALVRPGRVDMHVEFELPSREELRELFIRMYSDVDEAGELVAQPDIGLENLEEMAGWFANALPEKKLSIAAVQGFLLRYKRDPMGAVEDVEMWAEETVKKMAKEQGSLD